MCGLVFFFDGSCRDGNEEDDILAPEDMNEQGVANIRRCLNDFKAVACISGGMDSFRRRENRGDQA